MKTVMIFGTFDILHYGHLHLMMQARHYGDRIVAVVARDATVVRVKGKKPFHTERERKQFLDHIDLIDEARLGDKKDIYKNIRIVKPDVICLGYDQRVFVDALEGHIARFGLKTRIVRLKPFKENQYKTTKIKEYLDRMV